MLLEQMSDEDLIFLIRSGSKAAEASFYKRYSNYSRHAAKVYVSYFEKSGISEDEFYALAFSKVHEALARYESIEKHFYIYWKTVVKNAVYDYIRDNSYQFGAKALAGISFDDLCYENNDTLSFYDVIGENDRLNQLGEFVKEYLKRDDIDLSEDEKLVADLLFLKGYSRSELGDLLGWKKGKVHYVAKMVTEKFQRLLKENYL